MTPLKIDPEFRDKIPPLSDDEFKRLEENIIADGAVREPLVVWNGVIIDGHHRWKIIQKHPEIPYTIKEMDFADRWAAISWMCSNQLGRRNITDAQKTYLLGKLYEARKLTQGTNNQYVQAKSETVENRHFQSPSGNKTRAMIASEQNTTEAAVRDASFYAKGLDEAEKLSPGIREKVLSGEVKAPKSAIAEIRKMSEEEKAEAVKAIENGTFKRKEKKPEVKSEEVKEVEAMIAKTNDINREIIYTADDLINEVEINGEDFIKKLKRIISMRKEIVDNNSAIVQQSINKLINELEKIKEKM